MIRAQAPFAPPSRVADARELSRRMLLIRLLLLVSILLAFGRILGNDFVDWDDSSLIYTNKNLNPPTLVGLARHWNPNYSGNIGMYDPVVFSAWWFISQGAQLDTPDPLGATLNPILFHGANLIVHWLSACMVLEILLQLGLSPWPAALGTLIFAIHPLQTEPVAWATGMKDLISGFFSLASVWCYLLAMKSPPDQRRKYWIAALLYTAALLAKPSAVIVPAILWMLDVVFYHRPWKQSARRLAPWLIPALAAILVAKHVQPTHMVVATPLWSRPLVALDALAFYLWKLILPMRLNFDYGRNPTAIMTDPTLHQAIYWTWIFPVVLAILIFKSKRKELKAAGFIFVLGVLPVLGLTPFIYQFYSTVADRYVYLSMLGVALAVGWMIQRWNNRFLIAAVCAELIICCGVSFLQAGVWKDSETLYERGIELNPGNANHYFVLGFYRDTESDIALRRAKVAASTGNPIESRSQTELGQKYLESAIDCFRSGLAIAPRSAEIYDRLSYDLILLGKMDEAITVIQQLIDLQPNLQPNMRQEPASLHYELAMAFMKAKRYPDAITEFKTSLRLKQDAKVEEYLNEARLKWAAASQPSS